MVERLQGDSVHHQRHSGA